MAGVHESAAISGDEGGYKEMVTFSAHKDFPSLKLEDFPSLKQEVEESSEGMSPRNMWQVYALGGFMILRWAWARWWERKSRGEGHLKNHPFQMSRF